MLVKVYCTGWYFADLPDAILDTEDCEKIYSYLMKKAGKTFPITLNDLSAVYDADGNSKELIAVW